MAPEDIELAYEQWHFRYYCLRYPLELLLRSALLWW